MSFYVIHIYYCKYSYNSEGITYFYDLTEQIIRSELTKGVDRTSDREHYLYVTSIIRTQYAWHLPSLPFLRTSTAWGITELKGAVHPDMQMLAFYSTLYVVLTDVLLFVCGKSKEKFSRITFTIKVLHTHYIQSLLDHTKALCKEQTKKKKFFIEHLSNIYIHMTNIWHFLHFSTADYRACIVLFSEFILSANMHVLADGLQTAFWLAVLHESLLLETVAFAC